MPLPIQKFREILFQLLYSYDTGKPREDDMIPLIMKEVSVTKKTVKEAQARVNLILEKLPSIDKIIGHTSTSYSFERIQNVERNILRIGIYELLFDDDIPPKVAIAEAIRLARKFGSPESASFINALLDNVYKSNEGIGADSEQIAQASDVLCKSEEMLKEIAKEDPKLTWDIDDDENSDSEI
jgi:transcription antitermination protein NusB